MTCVGTKEGIDKFCLSLLGRPLAVMHVVDAVLYSLANLFRFDSMGTFLSRSSIPSYSSQQASV